jgi:hypothetical protein
MIAPTIQKIGCSPALNEKLTGLIKLTIIDPKKQRHKKTLTWPQTQKDLIYSNIFQTWNQQMIHFIKNTKP